MQFNEKLGYTKKGNYWVTKLEQKREICIGKTYPESIKPMTIIEQFAKTQEEFDILPAFKYKYDKAWVSISWNDYYDLTKKFAKSLIKVGLEAFRGVTIQGFNSPQWIIANMGSIFANGIPVGIYPTNGKESTQYIVEHCNAQVIMVENNHHLAKYLSMDTSSGSFADLRCVVMWNEEPTTKEFVIDVDNNKTIPIYNWNAFLELGGSISDEQLEQRMDAPEAGNCCSLIYTSGTTGFPKGVMMSHDNFIWTSRVVTKRVEINQKDTVVSYLPLSHVAAQLIDIYLPLTTGACIYFAQPDALKGSLVVTLKEVTPTIFLGVPRVWEKMEEKIKQIGKTTTGLKKHISKWAKNIGLNSGYSIQKGGKTKIGYALAKSMVFNKVKSKLGLNKCKFFLTGAAPISKDTLDFFLSLGIPINEIYGMSESSGPMTISVPEPNHYKTASCGLALNGTEIKIINQVQEPNQEGEIICRGRHVFMGYLENEEETQKVIDEYGFLHSGDIGKFDKNNFLYITGRLKEIIITAGGENIPPVLIENNIKNTMDIISNVMVIGDKRKFLSCLITLKCEVGEDGELGEELEPHIFQTLNEFSKTHNLVYKDGDKSKLCNIGNNTHVLCPTETNITKFINNVDGMNLLNYYINYNLQQVNTNAISNAQHIQKFTILLKDFTIEGGELTPTTKLKRKVVCNKYSKLIDSFYTNFL